MLNPECEKSDFWPSAGEDKKKERRVRLIINGRKK